MTEQEHNIPQENNEEETDILDNDIDDIDDLYDIDDIDDMDDENITLDDYHKERKARTKSEESLKRAQKTIVEQKKRLKELEKGSKNNDVMTKADYAMERFIDKNPELEEYRDDISKYVQRGFSLEEAKVQVLNSDKSIANREKLSGMRFTDSDGKPTQSTVTRKDLESMNQNEYNKVMKLVEQGKMELVR